MEVLGYAYLGIGEHKKCIDLWEEFHTIRRKDFHQYGSIYYDF